MPNYNLSLHPPNHAAGDFCSRISGRLGSEIVRCTVNDHRSSDDIRHPEPAGQHRKICSSPRKKQRRQIPGMERMWLPGWIVVSTGIPEIRTAAVTALMDVKGIKSVGQSPDIRRYHGPIHSLSKQHRPADSAAPDLRDGPLTAIHLITPVSYYAEKDTPVTFVTGVLLIWSYDSSGIE